MSRFIHGLTISLLLASHAAAGVAGAETRVRVLFVLERQRHDLAELARNVSDPTKTASYGQYQSVESIGDTYGASTQTKGHVQNVLGGIPGVHIDGMDHTNSFGITWMNKQAVESVFGTVPSVVSPAVPPPLAGYVTHIVGAFDVLNETSPFQEPPQHPEEPFPFPMRRAYERAADRLLPTDPWPSWAMGSGTPESCPVTDPSEGSCDAHFAYPGGGHTRSFTPGQLRTAYRFEASGYTGQGRTAVVLQFGEKVLKSDIDTYATALGLDFRSTQLAQFPPEGLTLDFATVKLEATLDVETIVGLAKKVHQITLLTAPNAWAQFFTNLPLLTAYALDKHNTGGVLTDVISVSYGTCEHNWNNHGAAGAIEALELVFQTAAAAGVTVVFASGDQGSSDCASDTHPTPWLPNYENVDYPGSSPWVTAVGGTNLLLHPDNSIAEAEVWNDWPLALDFAFPSDYANPCHTPPCRPHSWLAGGGGASAIFDAPFWQQHTGHSKRMTPDIAYMADLYPATLLHLEGKWEGVGNGTSQAAPTFAAAVLLLNEFREKNNKPKIGFANPLLYHWGKDTTKRNAYFDVTTGNNKIGNNTTQFTHLTCCEAGPHWDAATGWGSLLIDRAIHNFFESDGAHVSFHGRASAPHHQGLVAHGSDPSKRIHDANTGASIPHPNAASISGVYTRLATVDSFNKTTGSEPAALTTLPAGALAEPGHGLSWMGLTDTDAYPIWLSARGFELDILSAADYYFDTATDIETRIYRGGTISLFEDVEQVVTEIQSYSDLVATMTIDWNLHGTETPNITVDVELPIGPMQIRSTETIQVDGSTPLGPYGVFDILGTDLALAPEPSPVLAAAAALLTLLFLRRRLH